MGNMITKLSQDIPLSVIDEEFRRCKFKAVTPSSPNAAVIFLRNCFYCVSKPSERVSKVLPGRKQWMSSVTHHSGLTCPLWGLGLAGGISSFVLLQDEARPSLATAWFDCLALNNAACGYTNIKMHFIPSQPVVSWCVLWVYLCHLASPIIFTSLFPPEADFPLTLVLLPWFWGDVHSSWHNYSSPPPCSSITSGRWIRFLVATFPSFFLHIPHPALLSFRISVADVVQSLFLPHLRSVASSYLWRRRWYFVIQGVFPHISCPCSPLEMWRAHWSTSSCLTLLPPN